MKTGTSSPFWSVSRGWFLLYVPLTHSEHVLIHLSSVATALGLGFEPYVEPVFKRSVALIQRTLQQVFAWNIDQHLKVS